MWIEVIQVSWWQYIIFAAVAILAIYGFCSLVGIETSFLTRRTNRTAQDMYGDYAGSKHEQRRHARQHGAEWRDDEDARPRRQ